MEICVPMLCTLDAHCTRQKEISIDCVLKSIWPDKSNGWDGLCGETQQWLKKQPTHVIALFLVLTSAVQNCYGITRYAGIHSVLKRVHCTMNESIKLLCYTTTLHTWSFSHTWDTVCVLGICLDIFMTMPIKEALDAAFRSILPDFQYFCLFLAPWGCDLRI